MSDKGGQHVGPSVGLLARCKQENRDLKAELAARETLLELSMEEEERLKDLVAAHSVGHVGLEENSALRDEIKQLRTLIAAMVHGQGGRFIVSNRSIASISPRDTFTQEDNWANDAIILTSKEN